MRSPTLAPAFDEAVHLVLCDFGKQGLAYVETELRIDDHGQKSVLKDTAREKLVTPLGIKLSLDPFDTSAPLWSIPLYLIEQLPRLIHGKRN